MSKKDLISIVVPCYNEESCIKIFYNEIINSFQNMPSAEMELIFIDDGSSDNTLAIIKELCKIDFRISYYSFSRNFGKEAAIYAGLQNAKGDYVALMDADLQDPPYLLPEMYRLIQSGEWDTIATRRATRKGEPIIRSFFAKSFYKLMNKISINNMVDGARDYRLMNRGFVDALLNLCEYNRFTKGLFSWVGFKTYWLSYDNVERVAGNTKWSFWKLFKYSIEGIVAFSTTPLTIATCCGLFSFFLSIISIIFIVIRKLMFGDRVSGWASTMSVILFLGGIQLLCIGILGQYLAKTYLETKNRPIYIVRESSSSTTNKEDLRNKLNDEIK